MRLIGKSVICVVAVLIFPLMALADGDLMQVREDFSKDPGWDWKNNRVVAEDPPVIKQDFGWAATNYTGAADTGEIGGKMWMSTTPAYYAMPLNRPLSFKDKFSFSCRIAFMPTGGAAAAYLGFFNHQLQGWRVWNSMAVRLGGESGGTAAIGVDSATADWKPCGGAEGYPHVPADGKPHMLRFTYDPDAVPPPWTDEKLKSYMTVRRQSTEELLAKAQKDDPKVTKEELEKRLVAAHSQGLIYYLQRTGHESVIGPTMALGVFWGLPKQKESLGAATFQVDDGPSFICPISKPGHDGPVFMDRFGLFNMQLYHQFIDLYLTDLTVNGHKVDLTKDPAWEGQGNRVEFAEQDFQRQNFGYSETNWTGEQIGELGGTVCRVEPQEPLHGYYADDIGQLSLDDPISFSGNLNFTGGATDAGMFFGYFNAKGQDIEVGKDVGVTSVDNMLGLVLDSPNGGFGICCTPTDGTKAQKFGPILLPTGKPHKFSFDYDPKANNGLGEIICKLDDETVTLKLTDAQRKAKGAFDHFGLVSPRVGGKYVIIYFDELTYTARRSSDYKPVFHKQEVTKTTYPEGGRKY